MVATSLIYRLAAVALIAAAAAPCPCRAAVRVCKAPHSSGIVVGKSETEAKRRAIEAWSLKVRVTGDARFAGWAIAAQKMLRCSPPKGGQVACVAIAAACTIQQVPPKKNNKDKPGSAGAIEA